jgi:hypothetical protein
VTFSTTGNIYTGLYVQPNHYVIYIKHINKSFNVADGDLKILWLGGQLYDNLRAIDITPADTDFPNGDYPYYKWYNYVAASATEDASGL